MSQSYQIQLNEFGQSLEKADASVKQYLNNYLGGHSSALKNTFPTLLYYLSDSLFSALAQVYCYHYPPENWDINKYGAQFAEFISAQVMGPKGDELNWFALSELAELEYSITKVYYPELNSIHDTFSGIAIAAPKHQRLSELTDWQELIQEFHPYLRIEPELAVQRDWWLELQSPVIRLENQ